MAAPANIISSQDVISALDVLMVQNFDNDFNQLAQVLGLLDVETVAAGTALYKYKVDGTLTTAAVPEGDLVPNTKYTVTKTPIGEVELLPYRKTTTAKAITKSGFETAVLRTDKKMLSQVRANLLSKFYTSLKTTATKTNAGEKPTLQAALAQADATLFSKLEANGDITDGRILHFVNPFDAYDYLGSAPVTTQTVFGLQYLEAFLGVGGVVLTNQIDKGTVIATPVENIHIYAADIAELSRAGLSYYTSDSGLIGVAHTPVYDHASAETNVIAGVHMLAEVEDYTVKATIKAAKAA